MPRYAQTTNSRKRKLISETPAQRILIEEFQFLCAQYLNRRTEAVTRVNFFITAVSISLGGVLVFGSGNPSVSFIAFEGVLLAVLLILFIIGLEIHSSIIRRDIASDRDIRGLARIRRYFIELDPQLRDYIGRITDVPTGYLVKNNSGMRRVMQIIEGFLLGLALMILSTFITDSPYIYVATGIGGTILTYITLHAISRRKFRIALANAKRETRFGDASGKQ